MALQLICPDFKHQEPIPPRYTAEGENLSPPLSWSGVPAETRQLALLCEDPDAPDTSPFVHWVLFEVPPSASGLPAGITTEARLVEPFRAAQGRNSEGD